MLGGQPGGGKTMRSLLRSTEGGKAGMIDGLNLFFGALLGANLGTLDRLPIFQYAKLILLLAGTVMAVRMVSTSEQRGRMLAVLLVYAALLAGLVFVPDMQPKGMSLDDLHRLGATLGIWIGFVILAEFSPVRKAAPADAEP
jgi:hypothetical protein